jgi:DNA-binding NarL/FixJ family response regulator
MTVTVVTVDDHAVFRATARDVIDATPGFEAAGEAASCEEALAVIDRVKPRLVLLDVRMPGIDGIQTAMRIRGGHPEVVVVLISMEEISRISSTATECGAVALVRKQDFGTAKLRELWTLHGPRD